MPPNWNFCFTSHIHIGPRRRVGQDDLQQPLIAGWHSIPIRRRAPFTQACAAALADPAVAGRGSYRQQQVLARLGESPRLRPSRNFQISVPSCCSGFFMLTGR